MMRRCWLVILAMILATDQANSAAPPGGTRYELQGRWSVLVWCEGGIWMTEQGGGLGHLYRNILVEFTKDRVILKPKGRKGWTSPFLFPRLEGTYTWENAYKTNSAKQTKEIDITLIDWGLDGTAKLSDKVLRGIYVLRGNKLTVCIDHADHSRESRRPDVFQTDPKRSHILIMLKREQK